MAALLLLLAIILLIAAVVLGIKYRLYGILVSVIGIIGLGGSWLGWMFNEALARNPGFNWMSPEGIPYSDIYSAQANAMTPYMIGSAVLIIAGVLWSVISFKRRHG